MSSSLSTLKPDPEVSAACSAVRDFLDDLQRIADATDTTRADLATAEADADAAVCEAGEADAAALLAGEAPRAHKAPAAALLKRDQVRARLQALQRMEAEKEGQIPAHIDAMRTASGQHAAQAAQALALALEAAVLGEGDSLADVLALGRCIADAVRSSSLTRTLNAVRIPDPRTVMPEHDAGIVEGDKLRAGGEVKSLGRWQQLPDLVELHNANAVPRLLWQELEAHRSRTEREALPPAGGTKRGYSIDLGRRAA